MPQKKKPHGGQRQKAGAKPKPDDQKAMPLTIYPKVFEVEAAGGKEKAKEIALNSIKNYGK